jgi:hypothetical protein
VTFDFTISVGPPEPEFFMMPEEFVNPVNGRTEITVVASLPNFGRLATHRTVKAGRWSDPSVWNCGQVPGAGAVVVIDHKIEYDVEP